MAGKTAGMPAPKHVREAAKEAIEIMNELMVGLGVWRGGEGLAPTKACETAKVRIALKESMDPHQKSGCGRGLEKRKEKGMIVPHPKSRCGIGLEKRKEKGMMVVMIQRDTEVELMICPP
jgi:hypothetical protein